MNTIPNQTGTVGTAITPINLANYVTLTNGDPILSYAIASGTLPAGLSFNSTTGVISGTPTQTGTFTIGVTATDNDGTSNVVTFTITINEGCNLSVPTASNITQPTCATPTGSITIATQSGVEYSVNNGTSYQSSNVFNGLAAGTFTLRVRKISDNTCQAQGASSITLNAATAPNVPTASNITQPTCATPTGSITIATQSGVEYSVNNGTSYQSSNVFNGLAAGTYTLRVRKISDNTCQAQGASSITLNAPTAPNVPTASNITQPTCATPTGSITIATQSGVEYSVNNGTSYQSSNVFNGIAAGTYTLRVRKISDNTCQAQGASSITLNAPTAPNVPTASNITQPTCATPTGSITIATQSGVEYSVNNGTNYQSSNVFNGLAAGTYTLSVRKISDNTCQAQGASSITLNAATAPNVPTASNITQPTCATSTGSITIATQSGVEYSVNNGTSYQSSNVFNGLAAGAYTLSVRKISDNTCQAQGASSITLNAAVLPNAPEVGSIVQPTCAEPTGTVTFVAQNDVQFSLDGSIWQSSNEFSGLLPGTYGAQTISINDATCISIMQSITINEVPALPNATPTSITEPSCAPASGQIVMPTANNVAYSINGSPFDSNPIFGSLDAAVYTIQAQNTQDPSCVSTGDPITLSAPTPPAAPTGTSPQQIVINAQGNTLEDLTVSTSEPNVTLVWFATEADALAFQNPLNSNAPISNGNTYYVVAQSNNTPDCFSSPLAITVDLVVGLETYPQNQITVYPNPTSTTIQLPSEFINTNYTLYNTQGAIVQHGQIETTTLNLTILSSGSYMLQIQNDGVVYTVRVVKE